MENINNYGKIEVSKKAFNDIGNLAISKVKGIYPVKTGASICDCSFKNNDLTMTLSIKVKTGIDVVTISAKLQSLVHEMIADMTGINCKKINIDIQGFQK